MSVTGIMLATAGLSVHPDGGGSDQCCALDSSGLVAHYSLDGDGADSSPSMNHAEVFGAVPTEDRNGAPNRAMLFDGIDDYLKASSTTLPSAERTVSFWFRAGSVADEAGRGRSPLGYGGATCGTSWNQTLDNKNRAFEEAFTVQAHCDNLALKHPYSLAPVDVWTHWVVTTSPTGTSMYLDGQLVAGNSTFINNTSVVGKPLAIGCMTGPAGTVPYSDLNVTFFDGALDDLRIYDRELSGDQVAALFFCESCGAVEGKEVVQASGPGDLLALKPGLTTGPLVGRTWDPVIDHTEFATSALSDFLIWSPQSTALDLGPFGVLLCLNPTVLAGPVPAGAPFAIDVPPMCSLIGVQLCVQGLSTAVGSAALSNALLVTVGSI